MKIPTIPLVVTYLSAVAVATLYPFNFRQPNLARAGAKNGLIFTPPSTAYAQSPPAKIARTNSFTILMRLSGQTRQGRGCIVDYAVTERRFNFRIEQQDDQLIFSGTSAGEPPWVYFRVTGALGKSDTISAALTCDDTTYTVWTSTGFIRTMDYPPGTRLYWDSTATLTFGSTVNGKFWWRGTLLTFAVFDRPLGQHQLRVADSLITNNRAVLAYEFPAIMGGVVIDRGRVPAVPLLVPDLCRVPGREVLATPANYWHGRWYARDILYNIIGFLPFGFLVFLLRAKRTSTRVGIVIVILSGAFVSLSIEMLQAMLPARSSTLMDVVSNTTGAWLGAWLAERGWPQRVLGYVGVTIGGGKEAERP